jgi:uncharacterized membrane protein (DUF2068 family)
MHSPGSIHEPPILQAPPALSEFTRTQRAPTLYAIIAFKFLKGLSLVLVGLGFFLIQEGDLRAQIADTLRMANVGQATSDEWLKMINAGNLSWLTIGSVIYGLFSWLEGLGLFLRATWAAWAAIGESAAFVPVEMWQLGRGFSVTLFVILLLNIGVVWYLYHYRGRLFHKQS